MLEFSGQVTTPDRFSYHTGPVRSCLPTFALSGTPTNSKAYSTLSNLTLWQPDLNLPPGQPGNRPIGVQLIAICAVVKSKCAIVKSKCAIEKGIVCSKKYRNSGQTDAPITKFCAVVNPA